MTTPETTTPGPWHIEREQHACRYEVWPKDDGKPHSYVCIVQRKADAQLIAAAPELIAKLRGALLAMVACPDYRNIQTHEMDRARKALEETQP